MSSVLMIIEGSIAIAALKQSEATSTKAPSMQPPAATAPTITVTAQPQTDLSPIVITAMRPCLVKPKTDQDRQQPKILDTYPRDGQTVPSGVMIFSLKFDRPMSPCYHRMTGENGAGGDMRGQNILFSRDLKVVHYLVYLEPNRHADLDINEDPCHNFRSIYGSLAPSNLIHVISTGQKSDLAQAARMDPLFDSQGGRAFIAVKSDSTCWR